MIRTLEATGKTVEEARAKACAQLGVEADALNVSFEVLEMPQKTGFLGLKLIPAKVRVSVEEPDLAPVPEVEAQPAAAPVQPEAEQLPQEPVAAVEPQPEQPEPEVQAQPEAELEEQPIEIDSNPKVAAAVAYLKEVIEKMGVQDVKFSAVQKGEATIICLDGEKLGALIGRRGETMESLSYLASLVANRLEGDYIKLGLDVAGYRGKRESDLTALAQRIGAKVRRTGRSFAMEPMNPYERRIIHSAISSMEGVRSESKGEGRDRRVVIYSTDPAAQNDSAERRPRRSGGGQRRGNGNSRRYENDGQRRSGGGYRGSRPSRGPRPSSVPERTYAPRDAASAEPVAPKRTERVDDFEGLGFGKIEL